MDLIKTEKYYNNSKLLITESMGLQSFKSLPFQVYRKADGIILAFDLNDKDSFLNYIPGWVKSIDS